MARRFFLLFCFLWGILMPSTASKENVEVVVGDKSYSLLERPPANSQVVQSARKKIPLDVHAISRQLDQVGNFIRIAYNGLAMHSSLQGKVTNLAIRVTMLGDESALTIAHFQRASERVVSALEATYWYIYHDHEDVARDMFTSVSGVAGEMAKKAMELHQMYEQEVRNVQDILGETANTKEYEEHVRMNLTQMMNDLEARIKGAETTKKQAFAAFKDFEHLFHEARKREYKAIDDQTDPWKKVFNGFTSFVAGVQAYDFQAYKSAEEAYRQEKLKYLDEMEKQRKIRDEALVELEEFVHRVQNCRDDTQLADITIDALQNALGGLKLVALILVDVTQYWKSMQMHCDSMQDAGTALGLEFESLMRKDVETRRQLWREQRFMTGALKLYSQWVALGSICEESLEGLKPTLQNLRDVIRENPTRKEALENVRKLAKDFAGELALARKLLESDAKHAKDEL